MIFVFGQEYMAWHLVPYAGTQQVTGIRGTHVPPFLQACCVLNCKGDPGCREPARMPDVIRHVPVVQCSQPLAVRLACVVVIFAIFVSPSTPWRGAPDGAATHSPPGAQASARKTGVDFGVGLAWIWRGIVASLFGPFSCAAPWGFRRTETPRHFHAVSTPPMFS